MVQTKNKKRVVVLRNLFAVVLLFLFGVIVLKNWSQMQAGFTVLATVSPWWLLLGALLYAVTQVFGATAYFSLALKKVVWRELYVVEWASAGINRLLPAGAGSMGIHGLYLLKRKHSVAEAVTVVGLNNLLTTTCHMIMLLLIFALVPSTYDMQNVRLPQNMMFFILISTLCGVLVLFVPKIRQRITSFLVELKASFMKYEKRPLTILRAIASVLGITLTHVLLLLTAMWAIGLTLDPVTAFVVFSVGVAFGALFPTPGGLGGVEAGLVASLMAYDVSSAHAIAVAVLFRFITFWLPLVLGNIVFLSVRNKNYF